MSLTFGSFTTLGVLKVARTDVLGAVVAKPRGAAWAMDLGVKEEHDEPQRALDRAERERWTILRDAIT